MRRTHRLSRTAEYKIWTGIKKRCLDPKEPAWPRYGGRGIKICDRWLNSFETFLKDMGRRPSKNHSVDRIDGNGNYEPSNCRWATYRQQNNNRHDNYMVEYRGERMPIGRAVEMAGNVVSTAIARDRVSRKGWDLDRALTTPKARPLNSSKDGKFSSPHRAWMREPQVV